MYYSYAYKRYVWLLAMTGHEHVCGSIIVRRERSEDDMRGYGRRVEETEGGKGRR